MRISAFRLIAAIAGLALIAAACNSGPKVIVSGQVVRVEIAKTAPEQSRGLGGRDFLAEDEGMLFVFNEPKKPVFWMKDMKMNLDIIWIRDYKVVEITENVPAEPGQTDDKLRRYSPASEVDMVLEVNAGWAKRHQTPLGGPVDLIE